MDKQDSRNLKRRYLLWLYKTTKEAVDRIERKFTQLDIDRLILKELKRLGQDRDLGRFIGEFKAYIQNKEKDGLNLKYAGKKLKPEYHFLILKLQAIEKVIIKVLGKNTLREIKSLYEEEMASRILKSTEKT